jgi:putative DNA methylase
MALQPYEWKDKPALIEHLFPVQKISAESYKEQMANLGKTLTALGSYWKGRKPLVLNKACIIGSLLPVTNDFLRDLEIFEMLMGMDETSMINRLKKTLPKTKYSTIEEIMRGSFNEQVRSAKRAEELSASDYSHIWNDVNVHLGTSAYSFPELIEQLGIARFGHRPKVADVFSGSGQIPFEAARIGCDVFASDLNPIACMLTWGDFHIVGSNDEYRNQFISDQSSVMKKVSKIIENLGVERNKEGWIAKSYIYCLETVCPESGWKVPMIPNLIVSKLPSSKKGVIIAQLQPVQKDKRYEITIKENASREEIEVAKLGTIHAGYLVHSPEAGVQYRTRISTLRGDEKNDRGRYNGLRLWERTDFAPREEDVYQERLYAIHWVKTGKNGRAVESKITGVDDEDLDREKKVIDYVDSHLEEWQEKGYIPDMVIEKGYETERLYRERGWTHWHHLFNPRQLLQFGLLQEIISQHPNKAVLSVFLTRTLNWNSRLCIWNNVWEKNEQTFYNQALNTIFNYGCRSTFFLKEAFTIATKSFPLRETLRLEVQTLDACALDEENDIYITDPPYGDAVKYEEITEFFIAWLKKNPPHEFSRWTWDSRRAIAIKGEDEGFRQSMVRTYRRMAKLMPDNGLQIIMFTHKSGSIWADMTNIIWASGLRVTAAWYVVTETDSALRQGANVTGTIILVLRKRKQDLETFRDDLGWEIEAAVKEQVEALAGLDRKIRDERSEGLYTDADLQMAGYAAALKVLTSYTVIDGKNMVTEAEAPRQKGRKSFVDEMIEFAVQTAVQFLVPVGFKKYEWQKLSSIERYYLKMVEMEHQGNKTLDNYLNFAKAFKIQHYEHVISENSKANSTRLKLSTEFKGSMMSGGNEISDTPLRSLLYAIYELSKEIEVQDVLLHLMENVPMYMQKKVLLIKMAEYIAEKRENLKPTKQFRPDSEASNARIIAEAMKNQRL